MSDRFSVRGVLRVYSVIQPVEAPLVGEGLYGALYRGEATLAYETHNLIVNRGLAAIAKFLGGAAGAPVIDGSGVSDINELVVDRMELGDALVPPVPATTDIGSVVNLVYVPQVVVSYPTPYSVRFSGIVRHGEMNGTTFTEEALKMANGMVFAKVTGFSILKQVGAAKQFDHEIVFARA